MARDYSTTIYVLKALIPYTRENLALSFKPNKFFNELERQSNRSRKSLQNAYYRALDTGYIDNDNKLTRTGWDKVQPFVAKKLTKDAQLMVIFDIPQEFNHVRREFRRYLRQLGFSQAQQSVWVTDLDHTAYIKQLLINLKIENFVQVYEADRIC